MVDDRNRDGVQTLLAANLRRLRIARHLSLSELAREAHASKATLSGIENGRANPTVETLDGLARALGISIGELLEEAPLGEVRILRAAPTPPGKRGPSTRPLEGISASGIIEISELTLAPNEIRELQPGPHGSRAHIYLLAGKLIAGPVERPTELDTGDYISFPSDVPHTYQAGPRPVRALLIAHPPS